MTNQTMVDKKAHENLQLKSNKLYKFTIMFSAEGQELIQNKDGPSARSFYTVYHNKSMLGYVEEALRFKPKVLVLGEQFAHPRQRAFNTKQGVDDLRKNGEIQLEIIKNQLIPTLKKFSPDTMIIFTSAMLLTKFDWRFKLEKDMINDFNAVRVEFNEKLKQAISGHDNIYWFGANSKSAEPVEGNHFLVDGIHKFPNGVSTVEDSKKIGFTEQFNFSPPSLYYDIQRIYNLMCNNDTETDDNICCVDYF